MLEKMDMVLLNLQTRGKKFFERFVHEEKGASTFIEIGIIVVILVAVAVVFREGLTNLINAAFEKVTEFING